MKVTIKTEWYCLVFLILVALTGTRTARAVLISAPNAAHEDTNAERVTPPGNSDAGTETPPATGSDQTPGIPAAPPPQPPDDPCLPRLYHDWHEASLNEGEELGSRYSAVRLLIDRSQFMLTVEGILPDGSTEDLYFTHIGLGDVNSPTPAGKFLINHIYCYPDVAYFDPELGPIPHLYKGFLAPLLACDRAGRCRRFRQLGLHGFDSSVYPDSYRLIEQTYGPVSGGCIRVPEPCKLKALLIRLVGVGPLRHNDRGCYHWLNHPVQVVIDGQYPEFDNGAGLSTFFSYGLTRVRRGLQGFLGLFRP